jgi:hypothetical protein
MSAVRVCFRTELKRKLNPSQEKFRVFENMMAPEARDATNSVLINLLIYNAV